MQQKPKWYPQRSLALFWITLDYVMGCVVAPYLDNGVWIWGLMLGGVLIGIWMHGMSLTAIVAVGLCFFTFGAIRTQSEMQSSPPPEGQYQVTAYVYGDAKINTSGNLAVTLDEITLDGVSYEGKAYCTIYLYGDSDLTLYDGAFVSMQGRVYHPDSKSGEVHYDFALWMLQNDYDYGIAVSQNVYVMGDQADAPWKDVASRIRGMCQSWLEEVMPDHTRIVMALLFGQKEGLKFEESQAFQNLGVAHVFAVSGLHVGMIAGLLMWIMQRFSMRFSVRLTVLAIFLVGYCWLCEGRASCIRASVMLMFFYFGISQGLQVDPLLSLSMALLVILIIDPLQRYSSGLILSFSAVGSIQMLYRPMVDGLYRCFPPAKRPKYARRTTWMKISDWRKITLGGVRELICLSLSAQIGVMMPSVMYYHQLPLYGVLINLWIIPYVTVLIPVYLLVLLLGHVPLVGVCLSALAGGMTDVMLRAVVQLSELPYAFVRVASIGTPYLCLCFWLIVIFARRTNAKVRIRLLFATLVTVIAVVCASGMQTQTVRYIQLAVGQADAALLMEEDYTVAIDVGDDGNATLDYLLAEGKHLDAVIITHMHDDHMGGLPTLMDAGIEIGCVYLPIHAQDQQVDDDCLDILDQLIDANIPIQTLAQGDELRYNETVITITWPSADTIRTGQDANDYGLALAIDFHGYTLLSMADIPSAYEIYAGIPCDVLKVGHHGSAYSTSETFLSYVQPSVGLVSCSSGSSFLPSESTLERLMDAKVQIYRTDEQGDITLTVEEGVLYVTPYKGESER